MTDLVALIIGISHYPKLAQTWNVRGSCTAKDAIAVTEALVAKGVKPGKIKLLLSMEANRPNNVAGVVPEDASRAVLEAYLDGLREVPGVSFFFFCSGHGVASDEQQDTLIVLSEDSRTAGDANR